MKKKFIKISIFLLLLLTPFLFTFAQTSSAGFIPGNIWYSKDPFEEGDKIKIYTLIYNPDARQLSGTVFFFDKTTFLGNKTFTVAGKGLKDIEIDWTVTAGDHLIFGQIQNAKFLTSNNIYEDASLSEIKTSESKRSVSKKIATDTSTVTTKTNTADSEIVSNVQNFIKENTPEVVSKTIDNTTNVLEVFRENVGTLAENKKQEVQNEINLIENKKISTTILPTKKDTTAISAKDTKTNTNQNLILKPLKYAELFALSLFSTVFNNKYIFYGILVLIVLLIIRFIIRRFF